MVGTLRQGWWFATGLRRHVRQPATLAEARPMVREGVTDRAERLVTSLDRMVWSMPSSPYHELLAHVGFSRDDVAELIRTKGVEPTLEVLRDEGVYVSYEEYLGREALARGSLRMDLSPTSFSNQRERADYLGGTGGTRSGGIPVAANFADKRRSSMRSALTRSSYGLVDGSSALWLPALPSAAGLGVITALSGAGQVPERWFSQVHPLSEATPTRKRAMNLLLPVFGRAAGVRLPRPRYVPASEPAPVLEWCVSTLERDGYAYLVSYPSSVVRLAVRARRDGVDLTGLVVHLVGEPVTAAKADAIRAAGIAPASTYAFMQKGGVARSCPACGDDEYHLMEDEVGLITRRRARPDGVMVDAFLWTTLQPTARSVMINVENDDYGTVSRDEVACGCDLGALGIRARVSQIRGISKVVAGGVTVSGEVLENLVERVLPDRLGGNPGDFQLAEEEREGEAVLVVRADPSVPAGDEEVLMAFRDGLEQREMGALASGVWSPGGSVRVERRAPVPARSGKILPYEPLR